jgi:hypothetical protein
MGGYYMLAILEVMSALGSAVSVVPTPKSKPSIKENVIIITLLIIGVFVILSVR